MLLQRAILSRPQKYIEKNFNTYAPAAKIGKSPHSELKRSRNHALR
jgi:hypothetical protein